MRPLEASAPGKAVLIGEYAVLEGAPAIAAALDRRARVRIEATGEPYHRVTSANSGARAVFRARPGGEIEWLDGAAPGFALLEHVWRAVEPEPRGGLALTLDSRELLAPGTGTKLGFGSSAALAVALAAALAGDNAPRETVHGAALRAHRAFQQDRGSGVDVAAAFHGGLIGYRRTGERDAPRVEGLAWPAGLGMCLLWSGRPADTAARLERLGRRAADRDDACGALAEAAEAAYREWPRGASAALAALSEWARALLEFGRRSGLDIYAAGHDALYEEALRQHGLVYKPCGAGGGDCGAAFALDAAALDAFAVRAGEHGFQRIYAGLDARGVTTESPER